MKSAASCETSCDTQDFANHRILERLTPGVEGGVRAVPRSRAPLTQCREAQTVKGGRPLAAPPPLPPSGEKEGRGSRRLPAQHTPSLRVTEGVCGAGGPRTWASRRPGASSASKAEQLPLLSTGTPLVLRGGCAGAGPPLLPSMAGGAPAPRGTDKGSAIPWCPVGLQSCKARPGALGVRPAAGVSGGRERARVGVCGWGEQGRGGACKGASDWRGGLGGTGARRAEGTVGRRSPGGRRREGGGGG